MNIHIIKLNSEIDIMNQNSIIIHYKNNFKSDKVTGNGKLKEPSILEAESIKTQLQESLAVFPENPLQIANLIVRIYSWLQKFQNIPMGFVKKTQFVDYFIPLLFSAKEYVPTKEVDGKIVEMKPRRDKLSLPNIDTIIRIFSILLQHQSLPDYYFKRGFFVNYLSRIIPSLVHPIVGFNFLSSLLTSSSKICLKFLHSRSDCYLQKAYLKKTSDNVIRVQICTIFMSLIEHTDSIPAQKFMRFFTFVNKVLSSNDNDYLIPSFFDLMVNAAHFSHQTQCVQYFKRMNIPLLFSMLIQSSFQSNCILFSSITEFITELLSISYFDRAFQLFSWNLFIPLSNPPPLPSNDQYNVKIVFLNLVDVVLSSRYRFNLIISCIQCNIPQIHISFINNSSEFKIKKKVIHNISLMIDSTNFNDCTSSIYDILLSSNYFETAFGVVDNDDTEIVTDIIMQGINLLKFLITKPSYKTRIIEIFQKSNLIELMEEIDSDDELLKYRIHLLSEQIHGLLS